jgi:hypothetical protein
MWAVDWAEAADARRKTQGADGRLQLAASTAHGGQRAAGEAVRRGAALLSSTEHGELQAVAVTAR